MKAPLVSVVIPTYQRPDYLVLTLESVANQTYQKIEIIVIDDGSEGDMNKTICDSFDAVIYKKIENSGGPARPRNEGIKMAQGTYIAFVDDDDIWHPSKIEKQLAVLQEQRQFGLVHGPCEVIDQDGNLQDQIIGRPGSPEVKHGDVKLRMMGNWTLMMPTPLLCKEVLDKVGYFNETIPAALEDVEFWVRCSFYTAFFYLDEPLVQYRKHASNISANRSKYVRLPLYLNSVRKTQLENNTIDKKEANHLLRNLSSMQLKMVKFKTLTSLKNMFSLDAFWFFKVRNLILLAKLITS
ncbi:MAG: glycosyltransferase family A protein [Gilvibacter sp.]